MDSKIYPQIARKTLEEYLQSGKIITPDDLKVPEDLLQKKAGVFVSLHKREGDQLRGCIGTFLPTKDNVAEEIIRNAISAAIGDPRFDPVTYEELPEIHISVDVLSEPERCESREELDPKKYGVIVSQDLRKGLLLPDLPDVNTVEYQLQIACMKAGIDYESGDFEIEKFLVERYSE